VILQYFEVRNGLFYPQILGIVGLAVNSVEKKLEINK
jgi:hypothetical protein